MAVGSPGAERVVAGVLAAVSRVRLAEQSPDVTERGVRHRTLSHRAIYATRLGAVAFQDELVAQCSNAR